MSMGLGEDEDISKVRFIVLKLSMNWVICMTLLK